jgi:hypothetical protein
MELAYDGGTLSKGDTTALYTDGEKVGEGKRLRDGTPIAADARPPVPADVR